jgi:hypothetical protein
MSTEESNGESKFAIVPLAQRTQQIASTLWEQRPVRYLVVPGIVVALGVGAWAHLRSKPTILDAINSYFEDYDLLLEKLPLKYRRQLQPLVKDIRVRLDNLGELRHRIAETEIERVLTHKRVKIDLAEVLKAASETASLQNDASGCFLQKITRTFNSIIVSQERHLRTITYISYVLYPLGILVGVLGQLGGRKGPRRGLGMSTNRTTRNGRSLDWPSIASVLENRRKKLHLPVYFARADDSGDSLPRGVGQVPGWLPFFHPPVSWRRKLREQKGDVEPQKRAENRD